MNNVWTTIPFSTAVNSLDSKRIPITSMNRSAGPYPYWGASGVVDYVSDYIFDHPALLISEDGENLRSRKTPIAFFVEGQYWVNNHAHVFTAREGYDLRFLTYLIGNTNISGFITGSTQPKLTAGALASIPITVPGLQEQRRISNVLGSLDDLIITNHSLARKCESLAQTIAYSARKMIPLGELATDAIIRTEAPSGLTDHYSLPAFDNHRTPQRVAGSLIKSNKLIVTNPSVLIARLNPHIPRVWMIYPSPDVLNATSTEFVPIQGTSVTSEEVWAACSDLRFIGQMQSLVTGTTGSHQRVDKHAILELRIPNLLELRSDEKTAIRELVLESYRANQAAQEIMGKREELLPLLLSGAITAKEIAA